MILVGPGTGIAPMRSLIESTFIGMVVMMVRSLRKIIVYFLEIAILVKTTCIKMN